MTSARAAFDGARLRAAAKDDRVARLEREGGGFDGHVGARLVDHREDADRDADARDADAARAGRAGDDLAHRIGEGGNLFHALRERVDPLRVEDEPVNHRRARPPRACRVRCRPSRAERGHAVHVARVGRHQRGARGTEARRDRPQRRIFALARERGERARRGARAGGHERDARVEVRSVSSLRSLL